MSKATQSPQSQVEAFIQRAAPPVRPLLLQLRQLVRETLPDAREEIKWGRPVYSLSRIVCYLAAAKDHASLGFYRGADLRAGNTPLEPLPACCDRPPGWTKSEATDSSTNAYVC
jgi:hypothetical protein